MTAIMPLSFATIGFVMKPPLEFDKRVVLIVVICILLAAAAVSSSRFAGIENEYLPTVFGLKIKITDMLIVILTAALAIYTRELNKSTLKLWSAGERQIAIAKASADAAALSSRIARDTLINSNRAWVQGEMIPGDQPLEYINGGLNYMVGFNIQNTGNSPALKITFKAWLLARRPNNMRDPTVRHSELCMAARQEAPLVNYCLFPGQRFPEAAGITSLTIQAALSPEDLQQSILANHPMGDWLSLFVGGVVNYTFASDPEIVHQTSFLYELKRATFPHEIVVAQGNIPGRELRLGGLSLGDGRSAD